MGLKFREAEVRELTGMSAPEEGDAVLCGDHEKADRAIAHSDYRHEQAELYWEFDESKHPRDERGRWARKYFIDDFSLSSSQLDQIAGNMKRRAKALLIQKDVLSWLTWQPSDVYARLAKNFFNAKGEFVASDEAVDKLIEAYNSPAARLAEATDLANSILKATSYPGAATENALWFDHFAMSADERKQFDPLFNQAQQHLEELKAKQEEMAAAEEVRRLEELIDKAEAEEIGDFDPNQIPVDRVEQMIKTGMAERYRGYVLVKDITTLPDGSTRVDQIILKPYRHFIEQHQSLEEDGYIFTPRGEMPKYKVVKEWRDVFDHKLASRLANSSDNLNPSIDRYRIVGKSSAATSKGSGDLAKKQIDAFIEGQKLEESVEVMDKLVGIVKAMPFGKMWDEFEKGNPVEASISGVADAAQLVGIGSLLLKCQQARTAIKIAMGLDSAVAAGRSGQAIAALSEGDFDKAFGHFSDAMLTLAGVGLNRIQLWHTVCFPAGTPVRTPCGFRPIEEIQPGDQVLSRPEDDPTAPLVESTVTRTFSRHSEIWAVRLADATIFTTEEHPFYVDGNGWVAASNLCAGDRLVGLENNDAVVAEVSRTERVEVVYNFEASGYHTYFVEDASRHHVVWVHNQCTYKTAMDAVREIGGKQLSKGQAGYLARLAKGSEKDVEAARRYLTGRKVGLGEEEAEKVLGKLAPKHSATFGKATSNDYRATFFKTNPDLKGKVIVHHATEQQVLKRFPGVVSKSEIHSVENLRGIPKEINSELHLSKIRIEWNDFYKPFRKSGTAPTKKQLLEKASEIDAKYGSQFTPAVGGKK